MKKSRKLLAALAFAALVGTTSVAAFTSAQAAAIASNQTIKTESTGIYLYQNGEKVTTATGWITAGSYTYYFGASGKAYQAIAAEVTVGSKDTTTTKNVVVKTISGKKYGFDQQGHMVKGIYASHKSVYARGKLYYFNKKTGVVDAKKTKALQKASKMNKNFSSLKKLMGKVKKKKTLKGSSCFGNGGKDVDYYFANVRVSVWKKGSKLKVEEVFAR